MTRLITTGEVSVEFDSGTKRTKLHEGQTSHTNKLILKLLNNTIVTLQLLQIVLKVSIRKSKKPGKEETAALLGDQSNTAVQWLVSFACLPTSRLRV